MRNELRKYSIKKLQISLEITNLVPVIVVFAAVEVVVVVFFFFDFTLVAKVQFVFEYSNFVFCKNILRLRRSCFRVPLLPEFD